MDALVGAWDEGTWRRRAVIDPRTDDADFTDVVGVARPAALLLPGNAGSPERVPLGAWASDPGHMENLFLRRLDRSWSEDETVGIVTLLCVSGTIAGLEAIQPAIAGEGKRLKPSQIAATRTPSTRRERGLMAGARCSSSSSGTRRPCACSPTRSSPVSRETGSSARSSWIA